MKKNILIITDCPSPYKLDFLRKITSSYNLDIFFQHEKLIDRNDKWYGSKNSLNCITLSSNAFKRLYEVLRMDISKYDLFWNMNYASLECIIMALRFRLKHKINLMHADGGIYRDRGFLMNTMISKIMNLNHYFTSSGVLTDQYYQGYDVNSKNVFHYHFSSTLNKENQPIQRDITNKSHINLLSVGQFIHRKGYDVLLKAIQSIDNIHLTIVGGKPTEEYLQLVESLNLQKKVTFIDFVVKDELAEFYKNSDVFVLPTREDIWGLVINEAISYGLPVISTSECGAMVELNSKCNIGYIYHPENINELSQSITKLINNYNYYKECNINAISLSNEYTIEQMTKDYYDIFDSILGESHEL